MCLLLNSVRIRMISIIRLLVVVRWKGMCNIIQVIRMVSGVCRNRLNVMVWFMLMFIQLLVSVIVNVMVRLDICSQWCQFVWCVIRVVVMISIMYSNCGCQVIVVVFGEMVYFMISVRISSVIRLVVVQGVMLVMLLWKQFVKLCFSGVGKCRCQGSLMLLLLGKVFVC